MTMSGLFPFGGKGGTGMSVQPVESERPESITALRIREFAVSPTRFCCAVIIGFLVYAAIDNACTQPRAKARIASGFGFWNDVAGFDISQTLIDYRVAASTYGRAFWVGLLNTLLVAVAGIILATIIGFTIGIAAAVEELAGCEAGRWSMSSCSATSRCCCSCCSGTTRCSKALPELRNSYQLWGRRLSQQSRPLFCRSRSRLRLRLCGDRAVPRHCRRDRVSYISRGADRSRQARSRRFCWSAHWP